MDETTSPFQQKDMRKVFTRIGLALLLLLVLWSVISMASNWLISHYLPQIITKDLRPWIVFGINSLPLYLICTPIFLLMLKKIPTIKAQEKSKLTFGQFMLFLVIAFGAMYTANFVSVSINLIISMIKGSPVINPLDTMPRSNIWALTLFVGILAPIMEEFIFRGVLLNKLRRYGDTVCIFASGFAFGLFHGNLSQMLYAFAIGMILAYIALKTGTILYSIFIHMIINLYSVGLSKILITDENSIHIIIAMFVGLATLMITALAIVLFVLNMRKIKLNNSETEISPLRKIKIFLLNPGIIMYTIACLVLVVIVILR